MDATADWVTEGCRWVDGQLPAGNRRTGPPTDVRVRPWGRTARFPTSDGAVWLKQPPPALRFELAILAALTGEPGMPAVVALDRQSGRVLLDCAGEPMQRIGDGPELAAQFAAAWPLVAALQRASMSSVPDLLAAGVADLRPTSMPQRLDEAIARARGEADESLLDRLVEGRPRFVLACAELAASAVPAAVDHNDVHDGNLMVAGDDVVTLIDWGDAVVAHPFASLLVMERVLASLVSGDDDSLDRDLPAVAAARAGYLAGFADLAPREDLERTARVAVDVAQVGRAWTWQRALATAAAASAGDALPAHLTHGPRRHLELAADAFA